MVVVSNIHAQEMSGSDIPEVPSRAKNILTEISARLYLNCSTSSNIAVVFIKMIIIIIAMNQ